MNNTQEIAVLEAQIAQATDHLATLTSQQTFIAAQQKEQNDMIAANIETAQTNLDTAKAKLATLQAPTN